MNDEHVKAVIDGLNRVARDMEHWKFREDMDRTAVEDMRRLVLEGVKMLYEQENVIKAMMGEFGDSCDVDGAVKGLGRVLLRNSKGEV